MTGFPGPDDWREPEAELLEILADHGASAAHIPVMNAAYATGAGRTLVAVRAALRVLLANGLITAVPMEDWPEYLLMDPPGPAWTTAKGGER